MTTIEQAWNEHEESLAVACIKQNLYENPERFRRTLKAMIAYSEKGDCSAEAFNVQWAAIAIILRSALQAAEYEVHG